MWWMRTVTWARAAAAIWAGTIGVLAVLQSMKVLPAAPKIEAFVWIVSLSIIAVDNAGTLISRRIHSRRSERNHRLQRAAMSLAIAVARATNVRFETLGVNVYIETRWSKFRRRTGDACSLKRIDRFRPAEYPQQSGVSWTGTKGTVGECWRAKRETYKDWHAIARSWGGAELNEEAFQAIPTGTRQGFTRTEFMSIAGKYSEILTEPIWHGNKERELIGVLAIDRSFSAEDDPFIPRLNGLGTREAAAASASAVSAILKPMSES